MEQSHAVILSYDMLLNPLQFVFFLLSYKHKKIYLKQLEALTFLEECALLFRLAKGEEKPEPFYPEWRRAIVRLYQLGILYKNAHLDELPSTDDIKQLILEDPVKPLDYLLRQNLGCDDHPKNVLAMLPILKESIKSGIIDILPEKLEYVAEVNKEKVSSDAYDDLYDNDPKHYHLLPRYTEALHLRTFSVNAAIIDGFEIATSNSRYGRWLYDHLLKCYSLEARDIGEISETLDYDPGSFTASEAIRLLNEDISAELLEKILRIHRMVSEKDILKCQLKADLALTLVGLHPLGAVANAIAWVAKFFAYRKKR